MDRKQTETRGLYRRKALYNSWTHSATRRAHLATRTYKIDPAHSEAIFQVRHLVTKVRGRFSKFDGTIQFDEANPENSSVDFTIDASSIDTNVGDRDTHLKSGDFFDVEKFKNLTFKSK